MYRVNKVTIVAFAMMLCIFLQTNISKADTFLAGGANGWGFQLNGWPNGKTFKTGDVIGKNLLVKFTIQITVLDLYVFFYVNKNTRV